jgi:hypothetical protein
MCSVECGLLGAPGLSSTVWSYAANTGVCRVGVFVVLFTVFVRVMRVCVCDVPQLRHVEIDGGR